MKLSIVVLTCDKDCNYIDRLLSNIKECVTVDHEVIIMDNTETETLEDKEGVTIVRPSIKINLRQLEARRRSCDYVTGDYVWFVDADDEVLPVDSLDYDADIVAFNYFYGEELRFLEKEGSYDASLTLLRDLGYASWNKWYKLDVLKKAFSYIYKDSRVSVYEDNLIIALAMKSADTVFFANKTIYKFMVSRNYSVTKIFETVDDLNTYMKGFNELMFFFNSNFTKEELFSIYNTTLEDNLISLMLKRINASIAVNPDMFTDFYRALALEVPTANILKVASQNLATEPLETFDTLCETIKKLKTIYEGSNLPLQHVSFILHKACNKACPYCGLSGANSLTDDEIYNNFDSALSKVEELIPVYPQLLGGEPNLWSDYLNQKLVDRLKDYDDYLVFTNGTPGFWYTQEHCRTLTHVTDWETNMVSYELATDRDIPTIIVTHESIHILEDYLFVNKNKNLLLSPCTGSTDNLNITSDDLQKMNELVLKYGLVDPSYKLSNKTEADEIEACAKTNLCWQVDCNNLQCCGCCKSCKWFPLEELTTNPMLDCSQCTCYIPSK